MKNYLSINQIANTMDTSNTVSITVEALRTLLQNPHGYDAMILRETNEEINHKTLKEARIQPFVKPEMKTAHDFRRTFDPQSNMWLGVKYDVMDDHKFMSMLDEEPQTKLDNMARDYYRIHQRNPPSLRKDERWCPIVVVQAIVAIIKELQNKIDDSTDDHGISRAFIQDKDNKNTRGMSERDLEKGIDRRFKDALNPATAGFISGRFEKLEAIAAELIGMNAADIWLGLRDKIDTFRKEVGLSYTEIPEIKAEMNRISQKLIKTRR